MTAATYDGPALLEVLRDLAWRRQAIDADVKASPVIVAAAGWRSGSTLTQRLLMTDPELLVWGEPLTETNLVPLLAGTLRPFADPAYPARNRTLLAHPSGRLHARKVENLGPTLDDLLAAHRSLLWRLFGTQSQPVGHRRPRWGIKEVRYGAVELTYLRLLWPKARIIGLVRNPWDAWASYRGNRWAARWPDDVVAGPTAFALHWARIAGDLAAMADRGELAGLFRYEDLVADGLGETERRRLADAAAATITDDALDVVTSSTSRPISVRHRTAVSLNVQPAAARYGYDGPTVEVVG